MNKINLRNVVNPELKELFDTENSKPFMALKSEPFSVSTGQGSGSGPGETLLALLVPGATRAGKGDLDIDGGMWEVKGGSYTVKKNSLGQSNAWLDCSSIKASGLRAKFTEVMQKYLSKYWNKKITTNDGTVLTLSDLSRLADFRPSSIWALSYLFKQLRPEQRYSVLEELYDEIFPTLKKKYPKPFDSAIRLSAEAIMVQDTKDTLSDVQARLAMLEYMAGPYNAKGIVVFNKTTDEMMVIQGIKGINTAMKTNTLSTQTMTMQGKGDTKAHPGIFLTAPREEIEPQLGIIRTKPHKPKVRKIRESD
jgi:hypothetical protein